MRSRNTHSSRVPEWISGEGPEADVVISTRARLARSLADMPFPSRASGEDLSMVAREVRAACVGLASRFPGLVAVRVETLDDAQRDFLLGSRAASVELAQGGEGRVVILEPGAGLSIMVNEEDHIRLQMVMSGLVPEKAWEIVDWADDIISERLIYGFSERYGYLTASLSNVGTGLRISTMMHLAGLAMTGKLNANLKAAYDLGVSIRGMYGEGSRAMGDLFQISNEVTLGLGEREIVERVRSVAEYLLNLERLSRKEVLRERLMDAAARSLEKLKNARAIGPEQAINLMSPIRLAASMGLVENCSRALLNELLAGIQAGAGDECSAGIARAEIMRMKLADVHLLPG